MRAWKGTTVVPGAEVYTPEQQERLGADSFFDLKEGFNQFN
jgi:hypothetical protein